MGMGIGIFGLTGAASALYPGPAIVLSFVLAGVGCVFAGLCYAEFASLIPIAGSAYSSCSGSGKTNTGETAAFSSQL